MVYAMLCMYVCMKYVRDSYFQNRWQSCPSPKWSLQNAMASLMIGKNYTPSLSLLPFLQNRIKKKGIKFGWHGSHPKGYNIQETKHPASLTSPLWILQFTIICAIWFSLFSSKSRPQLFGKHPLGKHKSRKAVYTWYGLWLSINYTLMMKISLRLPWGVILFQYP